MGRNEVVIDGRLLRQGELRYTPAGTPVVDVVIEHVSVQVEAGAQRRTRFELDATAVGEMAMNLKALKRNHLLRFRGFLAQSSIGGRRLALQVTSVESGIDGNRA